MTTLALIYFLLSDVLDDEYYNVTIIKQNVEPYKSTGNETAVVPVTAVHVSGQRLLTHHYIIILLQLGLHVSETVICFDAGIHNSMIWFVLNFSF